MKTFKLLPIMVAFSGMALAETATVAQVASEPVVQDNILPQLSFAAQQARAANW